MSMGVKEEAVAQHWSGGGGRRPQCMIESEVERWRTKARETAEGLMAQEIEAAISQAAKARCRELEAQCEAKCKDIEAAVFVCLFVWFTVFQ